MAKTDGKALTHEQVFGIRLKRERKARGWTQAELAGRLAARDVQLHFSAVAKIEAGTRAVLLREAIAIAQVLDVALEDMFRGPWVEWRVIAEKLAQAVDLHRDARLLEREAARELNELGADFGEGSRRMHPSIGGAVYAALTALQEFGGGSEDGEHPEA